MKGENKGRRTKDEVFKVQHVKNIKPCGTVDDFEIHDDVRIDKLNGAMEGDDNFIWMNLYSDILVFYV